MYLSITMKASPLQRGLFLEYTTRQPVRITAWYLPLMEEPQPTVRQVSFVSSH